MTSKQSVGKTIGIAAALALTGVLGFLSGCLDENGDKPPAPIVVYASAISDPAGVAIVPDTLISSGGPVTSYLALSPLPAGLSLDSTTGKVFGTPTTASSFAFYAVVAAGPGGKDTTNLRITVTAAPPASATFSSPAVLSLAFNIGAVNALAKTSATSAISTLSLRTLTVMLASNMEDTLRDTFTSSTSPGISATATTAQTLRMNYVVKPQRIWKVVAATRDLNDSLVAEDSASVQILNQDTEVSLNLSPRFVMYEVNLLIPDSINSTVAGTLKQGLLLNRLVLDIDGVTQVDSTSPSGIYFAADATTTLFYDYMPLGSHTIQLLAYGPMYAWPAANPLFSGATAIAVSSGSDSAKSWTLQWVGPTTNTGNISATVGPTSGATIINGGGGVGGVVP